MPNPINPGVPLPEPPSSTIIPQASMPPPARELVFSFKFLEEKHKRFDYKALDGRYFKKLLNMLRILSNKDHKHWEIHGGAHGYHPLPADKAREIFKNAPSDLRTQRPYQFAVADKVRVYGYIMNDEIFWVIYIDPNHDVYR